MGGNLFDNSKRIESIDEYCDAYHKHCDLFESVLDYTVPRSLGNKTSFGDLDILCDMDNKRKVLLTLKNNNIPFIDTGKMISYLSDDNHQIDIILVPQCELSYARDYYSFGDISIIMRVMLKGTGYKHSSKGLKYIIGSRTNKQAIDIHNRYIQTLDFMNLNNLDFLTGFENETELFEWVTKSKYFDASKFYDIEYMFNSKTRKNVKKRKMFMSFMEYVKNNDFDTPVEFPSPYTFYGFEKEVERLEKIESDNKLYRIKFNGIIVNELTGLEKRDLGLFMTAFKNVYYFTDILKMSNVEVINAIKQFYNDGWC